MSELRQYVLQYIADLETILANHADDDAVLAAAREQFGEADERYLLLAEVVEQQKKGGFGDLNDEDSPSPPNQPIE